MSTSNGVQSERFGFLGSVFHCSVFIEDEDFTKRPAQKVAKRF
jgi:hypothetical protein